MQGSSTSQVRCSGCGSTSFNAGPDGMPLCAYCGALYAPPTSRCPRCDALYDPGRRFCPSCGAVLVRECPICGALNPLAVGQCMVCDQQLDAIDAMFARLTTRTPDQLRRMRRVGAEIKSEEEAASKARLARLWADEARLREERARSQARRERQERVILLLTISLLLVAVIVAVVLTVTRSNPTPLL